MTHDHRASLGEHINTDSRVRDAVRGYIRQLEAPFILREIWMPLGLHRMVVSRELLRMHKAGLLTRHKIPVRIGNTPKSRNGAQHMMFLYATTEKFA